MTPAYDRRFVLQAKATVQNECGDVASEYVNLCAGWCALRSLASTEYWQAEAVQRGQTVKLFCRWDARMSADPRTLRALVSGTAYSVDSVENVNMRNESCVMRLSNPAPLPPKASAPGEEPSND